MRHILLLTAFVAVGCSEAQTTKPVARDEALEKRVASLEQKIKTLHSELKKFDPKPRQVEQPIAEQEENKREPVGDFLVVGYGSRPRDQISGPPPEIFREEVIRGPDGNYINHGLYTDTNSKGFYVQGKKHGTWEQHGLRIGKMRGVYTARGEYRNGKQFGAWTLTDQNGNTINRTYDESGKVVKK